MAGARKPAQRQAGVGDAEPEITRLADLVERATRRDLGSLTEGELFDLVRLYRFAATRVSLLETERRAPETIAGLRNLTARAHGLLGARELSVREPLLARLARFFFAEVPAAIRAEWRLLGASFLLLYLPAAIAWAVVAHDLDWAWALLDPNVVAQEISQLQATPPGEPFRGNFTFGLGESGHTAGFIMANNIRVGVLIFGSGLVPPLYVLILATNGLMVGTYLGVAGHFGQTGAISSILWCHGMLELQAIAIAGAAGLVLLRGWIAPGPWSRRQALRLEARRAWHLLAAVFPMLFFAGLIEGFVSPHVGWAARSAVAAISALVLVLWIGFGGRASRTAP